MAWMRQSAYCAQQNETPDMIAKRAYGKWVSEGEALGFDRPPRRYVMAPLWENLRQYENKS